MHAFKKPANALLQFKYATWDVLCVYVFLVFVPMSVFPKLSWLSDHKTLKKNLADHIIHEIFSADQIMKLCIEKLANFMIN